MSGRVIIQWSEVTEPGELVCRVIIHWSEVTEPDEYLLVCQKATLGRFIKKYKTGMKGNSELAFILFIFFFVAGGALDVRVVIYFASFATNPTFSLSCVCIFRRRFA